MSQPEVKPLTRVAFFVDNYQYAKNGWGYWQDLAGRHDAWDKACKRLEKMSFKCAIPRKNVTGEDLRQLPEKMAAALRNTHGALGLAGYSGHGMVYRGRLYLIPTDNPETLKTLPQAFTISSGFTLLTYLGAFLYCNFWFWEYSWLLSGARFLMMAGFLRFILSRFPSWLLLAWQKLTWHPLLQAYCLDELEAKLANVHDTHGARYATFFLVLDCCRDCGRLSWWHQVLLRLQASEKPATVKQSYKSSRPNFFQIYACEDGRQAFGCPDSHSHLIESFLKALSGVKHGCTLDDLLNHIDESIRASCSLGLQKFCTYSTSYRLAKQIIFWNGLTQAAPEARPTLMTSMRKSKLFSLKPSEQHLFQRYRHSRDVQERRQIISLPALSEDLRALLLVRSLAEKRSATGAKRFLSTAVCSRAIKRQGLKLHNVELVICEVNMMQAKFLCDKCLALLGQAILARSRHREDSIRSVDRKMRRVDSLLARVWNVLDQHSADPYLQGRVEEVIAGSIAVHLFKGMLSGQSFWHSLNDFHRQAFECSGHFQRALHAYAEGALTKDAARLAAIWRLSAIFAALFARDKPCIVEQLEHFNLALAFCNTHHPNYQNQWVVKRVLAVANLGIQVVHPTVA